MRIHPGIAIHQTITAAFPAAAVTLLDREYATLNEVAWGPLHRQFVFDMIQAGLPEWAAEQGDCDDWAWLFRAWLIKRNWRQHASRVPVALFYLHYTTREGVQHAINAAIVRREDRLHLLPIEPQRGGGPFQMTPAERNSCTLILG